VGNGILDRTAGARLLNWEGLLEDTEVRFEAFQVLLYLLNLFLEALLVFDHFAYDFGHLD